MVLYQIRYSLSSKPCSNNLERKFSQEVGREKDMERELRLSHCAAASSLVTRQNERISPLLLLIFHCQKERLTIRTSIFWHDLAKTYWHHLQTHIQPSDLRTSCNTSNRSPLDFIPTNLFSTMSILPTPWRPLQHEGKKQLGCEKWPAIFTRCNYRNTLLVFFMAKIAAEYKAVFFSLPCHKKGRLTFTSGDDYQQNVFLMLWVCLLFSSL